MAGHGPARRGRRIALQAAPANDSTSEIVGYVCGAKPLPFGEITLTEGVEVPGASNWPRLEAWVNQRRVRPVYAGDDFIPYQKFARPLLAKIAKRRAAEQAAAEKAAAEAAQESDQTEE